MVELKLSLYNHSNNNLIRNEFKRQKTKEKAIILYNNSNFDLTIDHF